MPSDPKETSVGKPLVLVTGAAGKIGRRVTSRLLDQGSAVRALTTKPTNDDRAANGIDWRTIDFMASLDFAPHAVGCAAVVHLAAEIVDQSRMRRVNVEATDALAEAAVSAGVGIFCYISSASVYGSSSRRLVTENSPTVTADTEVKGEHWAPPAVRAYARSKLLGEQIVAAQARDMKVVIVRPTVVVDVGEVSKVTARNPLRQALVGKRHAHHVYVGDVAAAIVWLVARGLRDRAVIDAVTLYNIAEDEVVCRSYADLAKRLRRPRRRGAIAPTVPSIIDQLVEYVRFGALPWRHSFGRMKFSGERLMREGFSFPTGLEALYDSMTEREHALSTQASSR